MEMKNLAIRNNHWKLAILATLAVLMCTAAASQGSSPWVKTAPGVKVYGMLDIPLRNLHRNPKKYLGTVFEDEFKFYRIYHDKQDANPALRGQVIVGKTHFTACPVSQALNMIQIQITPAQEAWIRAHGISRQDAIRARVRFAGIAPGKALAFDLLEIKGGPRGHHE